MVLASFEYCVRYLKAKERIKCRNIAYFDKGLEGVDLLLLLYFYIERLTKKGDESNKESQKRD